LDIVPFDAAGAVVAAAENDVFDVTFLARDPDRAGTLSFTAPYVLIEGGYLVREESPLREVGEVDRTGIRMTVGAGSAYDLYLKRTIQNAEIVRAPTGDEAIERFLRDGYEVAAGVKAMLLDAAAHRPGLRVLPGRFMVIEQAMATVRGPDALRAISALIEELKATGFVARELAATGQTEATVAPPASS
jgi:polar amino acid transport system substrate-binding protein